MKADRKSKRRQLQLAKDWVRTAKAKKTYELGVVNGAKWAANRIATAAFKLSYGEGYET